MTNNPKIIQNTRDFQFNLLKKNAHVSSNSLRLFIMVVVAAFSVRSFVRLLLCVAFFQLCLFISLFLMRVDSYFLKWHRSYCGIECAQVSSPSPLSIWWVYNIYLNTRDHTAHINFIVYSSIEYGRIFFKRLFKSLRLISISRWNTESHLTFFMNRNK